MRDRMQTSGKRARLRSVASSGRPFFRPPACDRIAVFDAEIETIENGHHHRLQDGVADIQRRKAALIASAEAWRNDRILNIENEFDGAIKAALDQYDEDMRHLRDRLVDEVKRNRRRYVDTNGISSPQLQKKKARMPSTMQAASTRSSSAAIQSQQPKPLSVRIKLSEDEIRSDLKKIAKPFAAAPGGRSPRLEFVRVDDDVLYIGNYKFQIGDHVRCGRHGDIRSRIVDRVSSTDIRVVDANTNETDLLPLSFLRTGMASIEHSPEPDHSQENEELYRLNQDRNGTDEDEAPGRVAARKSDPVAARADKLDLVVDVKQD